MRFARALALGVTIGGLVVVGLVLTDCAGPTAIDVEVYSEVPCSTNAEVALIVADDVGQLEGRAASSSATRCDAVGDGTFRRGNVVIVPQGDKDKLVAFELATRNDSQPAATCSSSSATGCIVARRQLRFFPHEVQTVRVDLRLSCLDVKCGPSETCVKGTCIGSDIVGACSSGCDETNLGGDGGVPDAGPKDTGLDVAPDVVADAGISKILIGVGSQHVCSYVTRGTTSVFECWGNNGSGRLGDGTTTQRLSPTKIVVPAVTQVSARSEGTCTLHVDGSVRCWGGNSAGAVGDKTFTDRPSPTVIPFLQTVIGLGVGPTARHTCAILQDRTVQCWGLNDVGQLGDGTTTNRAQPTTVVGLSNASALALGYDFTCAMSATGETKCWGANGSGQIGDGTTTARPAPTLVLLGSPAKAIAAGSDSGCAILTNNSLKCWGDNGHGQIGDGTFTQRPTPVTVAGAGTNGVEIAMSALDTCLRRSTGVVSCWGENASGQIGDGTKSQRTTPTDVVGLGGPATQLSVGSALTCSVAAIGSASAVGLRCWGSNSNGQLGVGSLSPADTVAPTDVLGL